VIANVTVYCASSRQADERYRDVARRLGAHLASNGVGIVYGGGAVGSMGALADGALSAGGPVVGVLPEFMKSLEWGHPGVSDMRVVETMHARKHAMLELADAAVALPGGCGTLEEVLEAITWKRLGLYAGPIAIVNQSGFYDPLLAMLDRCVDERFMDERHRSMWLSVAEPEAVLPALRAAVPWDTDPRRFAVP
jgi:uncharacterized protein (TIGR00730 family)